MSRNILVFYALAVVSLCLGLRASAADPPKNATYSAHFGWIFNGQTQELGATGTSGSIDPSAIACRSASDSHTKAPHDGRLLFASGGPYGGTDKSVGETVRDLRVVHTAIDVIVLVDDVIHHKRRLIKVS